MKVPTAHSYLKLLSFISVLCGDNRVHWLRSKRFFSKWSFEGVNLHCSANASAALLLSRFQIGIFVRQISTGVRKNLPSRFLYSVIRIFGYQNQASIKIGLQIGTGQIIKVSSVLFFQFLDYFNRQESHLHLPSFFLTILKSASNSSFICSGGNHTTSHLNWLHGFRDQIVLTRFLK